MKKKGVCVCVYTCVFLLKVKNFEKRGALDFGNIIRHFLARKIKSCTSSITVVYKDTSL